MSCSNPKLQVGIVGGGIAGVSLAHNLCRHDHLDIQLFESASGFGKAGAGVSFGANAVRAIEGLGIGPAYRQVADSSPGTSQDIWFEWRRGQDAGYLTSSIVRGVGQSAVHRADFLDILARQLPEGVAIFNKRAISVSQELRRPKVVFADDTHHECDILIAADGITSSLRDYVLKGLSEQLQSPRFSGTRAYRGMVDSQTVRSAYQAKGLDQHLIDVPQMYLGLDAHVLTFPVRQGRLINVAAFVSDRSRAFPVWPSNTPWSRPVSQREMIGAFAGWTDAVHVLLECITFPTLWALHDLAELPGYVHGRVALIGDAAHAMLPHQGAGAGQGLEDAWLLARLLGDKRCLSCDPRRLLKAYDIIRRPRACMVQRTSREAGDLYQLRDYQVMADDGLLSRTLENRFDRLWDHDLQNDIYAAQAILGWADESKPPVPPFSAR